MHIEILLSIYAYLGNYAHWVKKYMTRIILDFNHSHWITTLAESCCMCVKVREEEHQQQQQQKAKTFQMNKSFPRPRLLPNILFHHLDDLFTVRAVLQVLLLLQQVNQNSQLLHCSF